MLEARETSQPTLVLIHGYPSTKELWEPVIATLRDRMHLVAYDVRGAGASDAPRSPTAYDFERLADDLHAVIDAVAPGRPVHLVGHDWGGLQGWEFATSRGFRGRLASFTSVAGPSLDQVAIAGRSLGRLVDAWRSWYILLLLAPGGPKAMSRLMLSGRALPGAQSSLADDAVNGANLYRRNIPRRMARPRRDAVAHVPVQLIVPRGDRYIPMSYYELAEQYAPALRRRVVDGSHWLPRTNPELVAEWIGSFVDEVEAGRFAS